MIWPVRPQRHPCWLETVPRKRPKPFRLGLCHSMGGHALNVHRRLNQGGLLLSGEPLGDESPLVLAITASAFRTEGNVCVFYQAQTIELPELPTHT
jgi:hypothetical protein